MSRPIQRSSSEMLLSECTELEEELVALKVAYEQYFMGLERFAPTKARDAFKKKINNLRTRLKGSTAAKFKAQSLVGKFHTYERLWDRTIHEIETGTFKRDILRLRRKKGMAASDAKTERAADSVDVGTDFDEDEDLDSALSAAVSSVSRPAAPVPSIAPAMPSVAPMIPTVVPLAGSAPRGVPVPVRPPAAAPVAARAAASARPPGGTPAPIGGAEMRASVGPTRATGALEDAKLRAVYNAYVTARKQCREDVSSLNYDSVADSLRRQVPELMKKHGASSVDFKVVIKDGKAVLRAVPK